MPPGLPHSGFKLQSTLAAASAAAPSPHAGHHPIACDGVLAYDEDGRFSCEHTTVDPGDPRTHHCIDHSVALLLIELALDR